jgi:hypothetical protein
VLGHFTGCPTSVISYGFKFAVKFSSESVPSGFSSFIQTVFALLSRRLAVTLKFVLPPTASRNTDL